MRKLCSATAIVALLAGGAATAQIVTDGTLGARVRLEDADVTIGADLGTIRGANLFHSFERFDIRTGGSATFTGPAGLDRVIARVTGGGRSAIDGTLRSTVPGADVYLVNPAGILFGPNARLDVPAGFHASTASDLRFPDGVFSAVDPAGSVLSVAPPEAFGFLGARPAEVVLDRGRLEVGTGRDLSLVGGTVVIAGDGTPEAAGIVRAPGGRLTLAGLGGPGTLSLGEDADFFTPSADGSFRGGVVALGDGALAETTGDGGGRVRVRTGILEVTGRSSLAAINVGATDATGGVAVRAEQVLVSDGSAIVANVEGAGRGGSIDIDSLLVAVDAGGLPRFTGITTDTVDGSTGDAGDVVVTASGVAVFAGGVIGSSTSTTGAAGAVSVLADDITIDGLGAGLFTGISSDALLGSAGPAGRTTVTVADRLWLLGDGAISSSTFGSGDAGSVEVTAGRLRVDGTASAGGQTLIASQSGPAASGAAGDVAVTVAGELELVGSGTISTTAFGTGAGGTVRVQAGQLRIDGSATPDTFTGIASNAPPGSTGDGGQLFVTVAGRLIIQGGGNISSGTFADGDAGGVTVEAGSLTIDRPGDAGATGIFSQAQSTASGDAGEVAVRVRGRAAIVGGSISSSTFGIGDAGTVTVEAGDLVILEGDTPFAAGIFSNSNATATGDAGEVAVTVRDLLALRAGGEITSNTVGSGDAGRVDVEAGRLTIDKEGAPGFTGIASQASASATGSAGAVTLTVRGPIEVRDGRIQSANLGTGIAGSVVILAGRLLLDESAIRSNSVADTGGQILIRTLTRLELVNASVTTNGTLPSGDTSVILLVAPSVVLAGRSSVTALTGDGVPLEGSGILGILARRTLISDQSLVDAASDLTIAGVVNNLRTPTRAAAEPPADPSRSLRDCAEERLGGRGSFSATGQGGLPVGPEDFLPAGRPTTGARVAGTMSVACAPSARSGAATLVR